MEKENKKDNKKGGSKIKIVIITIVAMLVVGAAGYFGYNLFSSKKTATNKVGIKQTQQLPTQQVQQGQTNVQGAAQNSTSLQQVVSVKTYGLDEFLVNLADEDSKRYLKVLIFVGYDNKKLDTELADKKPILRDAIISILTTKKSSDITPKGLDNIKMQIIQKINPMLEKGQLNNIYFNDVLVQ